MMLHRIEIGAQIQVDDIGLVSQNRLRHALDRSRRRPLWPIAKRSRLEVRLEDRFQDQDQAHEAPSLGDHVPAIDISEFSSRDGPAQVSPAVFTKEGSE